MNDKFPSLNLPFVNLRIRKVDDKTKVWDSLRSKYVVLTPEEYVRQHFTEYLISYLGYPRGLMGNEVSLEINGMQRRCDTLISDRTGKPFMVVEYKAPNVVITQQVFDQIARYNLAVGAEYLVVTNGNTHYCCKINKDSTYSFIPEIPPYPSSS